MRRQRRIYLCIVVAGILSLLIFGLERLALTDIFHGEPDLRLEWTIVNIAFLPILLFHVFVIIAAVLGLRQFANRGKTVD